MYKYLIKYPCTPLFRSLDSKSFIIPNIFFSLQVSPSVCPHLCRSKWQTIRNGVVNYWKPQRNDVNQRQVPYWVWNHLPAWSGLRGVRLHSEDKNMSPTECILNLVCRYLHLNAVCALHFKSSSSRASYQIRKIAGCACAGNAGNVFPTTTG